MTRSFASHCVLNDIHRSCRAAFDGHRHHDIAIAPFDLLLNFGLDPRDACRRGVGFYGIGHLVVLLLKSGPEIGLLVIGDSRWGFIPRRGVVFFDVVLARLVVLRSVEALTCGADHLGPGVNGAKARIDLGPDTGCAKAVKPKPELHIPGIKSAGLRPARLGTRQLSGEHARKGAAKPRPN